MLPLTTGVAVVLRERAPDELRGCADVARLIDAFADGSALCSVRTALARRDLRLLRRRLSLASSSSGAQPASLDGNRPGVLSDTDVAAVSTALVDAAASDDLQLIACVVEHADACLKLSAEVMETAARHGHFQMLVYLRTRRPSASCTTAAMDGAARNGHLDVVKWLHEHRTEGCTVEAMDGAARSGCLSVVKWLHANRSEGCTTAAMDGAARYGHLEVLKWLHANRREGCTVEAMSTAASEGHLHVVRWLFRHCSTESDPTNAYRRAALHGRSDIVKWIRSRATSKKQ